MKSITKDNENPLYMMFNEKHNICNNRFDTLDGTIQGCWYKLNPRYKKMKRSLVLEGWSCIKVFVNIIRI